MHQLVAAPPGTSGGVATHLPSRTTAMNQLGTVYATKRRRRNGKSLKPPPKDGVAKSNPSKRHRERLNAELDTLASLLPFEQNILSKLDRLSILRLSVSYLRTKSYFHVVMHRDKEDGMHGDSSFRSRDLTALDHSVLDGDMFLQALNGFLLILTCEGEVFFATHSIESYLGFHQSDIVHQSVYELVHSEDREELQRQLLWNSFLPPEHATCSLPEALLTENCHVLERSFTVRFRCLLDNTSGFLRLDIRGRVKVLHGQNRKTEEPPLALFAICTPFGPPSLLEVPQKEVMFKSKHKLDLGHVSMDQRGKLLLGYSDSELANMGGYHLVHFDDLSYVASAHQELLKTGASGMIAYRYQTKEGSWQWLQTSSRLVYKNSKPDFVISTHRPLMEEEGRDLLGKRTMDFKVSYLDAGLTNSYFTDSEMGSNSNTSAPTVNTSQNTTAVVAPPSPVSAPPRVNRRYKTQLRDFLSTCRTKRKLNVTPSVVPNSTSEYNIATSNIDINTNSPPQSSLILQNSQVINSHSPSAGSNSSSSSSAAVAAAAAAATAAAAAAYSNMYYASGGTPSNEYIHHQSQNFHQQLYPTALHPHHTSTDNRFLTDNLFHQYRPLPPYYPDYHHAAVAAVAAPSYVPTNGYLDVNSPPTRNTYESHLSGKNSPTTTSSIINDDRLYSCQLDRNTSTNYLVFPSKLTQNDSLYSTNHHHLGSSHHHHSTISPVDNINSNGIELINNKSSLHNSNNKKLLQHSPSDNNSPNLDENNTNGLSNVKLEDKEHLHHELSSYHPANDTRQTVLMWGSGATAPISVSANSSGGSRPPSQASSTSLGGPPVTSTYVLQNPEDPIIVVSPKKLSPSTYNINNDPLKSLAEMNTVQDSSKWVTTTTSSTMSTYQHLSSKQSPSRNSPQLQQHNNMQQHLQGNNNYNVTTTGSNNSEGSGVSRQQLGGGIVSSPGGLEGPVKQQQERSPLLSISEVTNTLLDHHD